MKINMFLFLAFLMFGVNLNAEAKDMKSFWVDSSDVVVLDGDTLLAGDRIIRLFGVDAPEVGQKCDHNGHMWSCGMTAAMLDAGTALASKQASPHYLHIQQMSKEAEFGIWGSEFQNPEEWVRKAEFESDKSECIIKTFEDKDGEKYFATPLMRSYRKVENSNFYCSDETALLDGYHPYILKPNK